MNRLRDVNREQLQTKVSKQDCDSEMNAVLFFWISGKSEELVSCFQERLLKKRLFFPTG